MSTSYCRVFATALPFCIFALSANAIPFEGTKSTFGISGGVPDYTRMSASPPVSYFAAIPDFRGTFSPISFGSLQTAVPRVETMGSKFEQRLFAPVAGPPQKAGPASKEPDLISLIVADTPRGLNSISVAIADGPLSGAPTPTPLPAPIILLGSGLGLIALVARRRRKQAAFGA